MAAQETPILHYFDLGRLGRGEVIRIFLRDAGIEFNDIRYPYESTWKATTGELANHGATRTRKLPALEYGGKILTQHLPILRFLARDLGRYDGETNEEKYLVDVLGDIYIDWRVQWVNQLGGLTDEYKNEYLTKYYDIVDQYYSEQDGPYLLGDKISYADFAIYQSIDNDERIKALPAKLPAAVQKFREAFEARPNIAAYIKEGAAK
ncbi:glutathione S-transferase [Dactylonectria estremocensis]|uniref:Glutathione S-transferase n=1 Tax=Dactylonectria estremocensis TaxID=1079267 RepID=A0A9P9FDQ1_9HYPO|nr:glutathione S-transferase [Dactylonectria estremocensis]